MEDTTNVKQPHFPLTLTLQLMPNYSEFLNFVEYHYAPSFLSIISLKNFSSRKNLQHSTFYNTHTHTHI